MQPKLHSINALAVELRRDRRALARDLADLVPGRVEQQGGRTLRWYYLADVISHLYVPAAADGDDVGEFDTQRERLAAAQAEKYEHENAIRRRQIAWMPDVDRAVTGIISNARAKLLNMGPKLGPQLVNIGSAAVIASAIRSEVHQALAELATYDPGDSDV